MDRTNINIARSVAPQLGEGWRFDKLKTVKDNDYHNKPAYIINGKYKICFENLWGQGAARLGISAELPSQQNGKKKFNKITVNRNRPVKTIIAEINRRVLKGYEQTFLKQEQLLLEQANKAEKFKHKSAMIKKLISSARSINNNPADYGFKYGRVELRRYSDDVTLSLTVPIAKACKILSFLNDND